MQFSHLSYSININLNYVSECNGKHTAWPKKSHHLDLTRQIGRSFSLENYCMVDYVSAGNNLFNPKGCSE